MDLNRVQLKGNICNDIELKNPGTEKEFINLRIATNRGVKKQDGSGFDSVATFHNVTCFKWLAKYIGENASKGDSVFIEGTLTYTEKDGKYYTNILASDGYLIKFGKKKQDNASASTVSAPPQMPTPKPTLEEAADDLPF